MGEPPFADRASAGRRLAADVAGLGLQRPLVLGVPRGGVVVAAVVADALHGDLDVVVVRKIGAPGNPELGLGAVSAEGDPYLDQRTTAVLHPSEGYLRDEIAAQRAEARRRVVAYRGDREPVPVADRQVVVVDDGIATGGTVLAAGHLLRSLRPERLVLAVPVAPVESLARVSEPYDDVVCPFTPEPYMAVGQWYLDFHQVSDAEVEALLARRQ